MKQLMYDSNYLTFSLVNTIETIRIYNIVFSDRSVMNDCSDREEKKKSDRYII